ncbi:galactose-specific lectin nattectin-like [Penaeus chinensis]|uniref:C-type lectin domain-containing protein n=1 Tax=Penaeus chinensis TaxID=139456 RepID=S4USJ7_PENCE|nr:galactose-specific lectin nattectin-like [Penaeus chinensis]AGL93170.1 C-type lectin domain-containing protein [Penaeus chinensis]
MRRSIPVFLSLGVVWTAVAALYEKSANDSKAVCYDPYTPIGGRCLFVAHQSTGNWYAMRDYCILLRGDLLKLDDASLLTDIVEYIYYQVGESKDYWIGGSDEAHEDLWLWTDGTLMRTGVPLWYHCTGISQQPDGGTSENCAMLRWDSYYYVHDSYCYSVRSVICESKSL